MRGFPLVASLAVAFVLGFFLARATAERYTIIPNRVGSLRLDRWTGKTELIDPWGRFVR